MVTKVRMVVTFVGDWLRGAFWGARDVHYLYLDGGYGGVLVGEGCKSNCTFRVCAFFVCILHFNKNKQTLGNSKSNLSYRVVQPSPPSLCPCALIPTQPLATTRLLSSSMYLPFLGVSY